MSNSGIASEECSLTVCRCVTEVSLEGNQSFYTFTLILQPHAGGWGGRTHTFGRFHMSFRDLPKDKFICLKLSFQWTVSLRD